MKNYVIFQNHVTHTSLAPLYSYFEEHLFKLFKYYACYNNVHNGINMLAFY